jgi:hypothetical protein
LSGKEDASATIGMTDLDDNNIKAMMYLIEYLYKIKF